MQSYEATNFLLNKYQSIRLPASFYGKLVFAVTRIGIRNTMCTRKDLRFWLSI
jgi:hypothetical protein